jgi:hypothetical protein
MCLEPLFSSNREVPFKLDQKGFSNKHKRLKLLSPWDGGRIRYRHHPKYIFPAYDLITRAMPRQLKNL